MKKGHSLIFILISIACNSFSQNCNYLLDAGEDIMLCENGDIQINANLNATPFEINWSPAPLFNNPNSLVTTATISSPTLLQLSVKVLSDVNLVNNGDFSQGDMGFTSDYIYGTGGGVGLLSDEGQYAVASNAGDTHNHFSNCNDHTGGGNMMVVNASGLPNNIWCQTIMVEANSDYDFSAWITSVTDENPAELQFSINGDLLGNVFNASSSTCFWQQFAAQWNSASVTSAEICIVNSNLTPNGNDFAIDDIAFHQICELTDELFVDINPANPNWTSPTLLCESDSPQLLNDWLDADATLGGNWTINNIPATEFAPQMLGSGLYTVNYVADNGFCINQLSQGIVIAAFSDAGQGQNMELCSNDNQLILLSDLLSNSDAGGVWTEVSNIPSSANAFNAVDGSFNTENQVSGDYVFEYTQNNSAPCQISTSSITVSINALPPANAGTDQNIDCTTDNALLGDSNADLNLDYQWTNSNGDPIGNTPTLSVNDAGMYFLSVLNSTTGCSNTDETLVNSNISVITLETEMMPISCNADNDGQISIQNVSGGEAPYLFSIDGENFVSTQTFGDLEAGNYTLSAMDVFGCIGETTTTIEANNAFEVSITSNLPGNPPILPVGSSATLNLISNIDLEQMASIIWTPDLTSCVNCTEINVSPTNSTNYTVLVTDINGCTASASIELTVDKSYNIYTPNAFSPNDDGINDIFYVNTGNKSFQIKEMNIMNRWGDLVFQNKNVFTNDSSAGWNGKFNGHRLNPGVYIFMAEIEIAGGEVIIEKGEVTLVY